MANYKMPQIRVIEKSFAVIVLGFSTSNFLVFSSEFCVNDLNTYKLFSKFHVHICNLFLELITIIIQWNRNPSCNSFETEIKFLQQNMIKQLFVYIQITIIWNMKTCKSHYSYWNGIPCPESHGKVSFNKVTIWIK